jgi:hypothetical protein
MGSHGIEQSSKTEPNQNGRAAAKISAKSISRTIGHHKNGKAGINDRAKGNTLVARKTCITTVAVSENAAIRKGADSAPPRFSHITLMISEETDQNRPTELLDFVNARR